LFWDDQDDRLLACEAIKNKSIFSTTTSSNSNAMLNVKNSSISGSINVAATFNSIDSNNKDSFINNNNNNNINQQQDFLEQQQQQQFKNGSSLSPSSNNNNNINNNNNNINNNNNVNIDANDASNESEIEIFLFFSTSEHGIKMQDSFPRKFPCGKMIGLQVPRLFFRNAVQQQPNNVDGNNHNKNNSSSNNGANNNNNNEEDVDNIAIANEVLSQQRNVKIFSKVMRDFVG
jgi:hypothetical protein